MIQRTTRIALEVVAGLVAVFVLLIGVALWRLSTGPVSLNFLTPQIEAALSDPETGLNVYIGRTELTWGGWEQTVDLHTRDVRIRDRESFAVAALPDVVVRLSLRALVQGTVAPRAVEIIGARLNLLREPDGRFHFGAWKREAEDGLAEADLSRLLPSVIDQLMSTPKPDRQLSFLTTVRLVGGQVSVIDRKLDTGWDAPVADIELRRDAKGLAGEVGLVIDLEDTRAHVAADFLYDRATKRIDLRTNFTDLHPEAVISIVPHLGLLASVTTPLDGSLSATLALDGAVDAARFELSGHGGQLEVPDLLPEPVSVARIFLEGRVSGPDRRFDLEDLRLSVDQPDGAGPEIAASGSIVSSMDDFSGDLRIEAEATAEGMRMADLGRYWPSDVAANGRRWVLENIPHGTVDRATTRVTLDVPGGRFARAVLEDFGATLAFHDLEVHYLRPLPPATGVAGTAIFTEDTMTYRPERGRMGDIEIRPTTAEIRGLGGSKQDMVIDLAVAGPLDAALGLLDHDRLRLIRKLGIDIGGAGGAMAGRIGFRFPLTSKLTFDMIDISARANLEDVALAGFVLGQDVTNGSLALDLDKTGMEARGPLTLGGVPMDIVWTESFLEQTDVRREFEAQIPRLDEAGRKSFGFDFAPYVTGPVSASVVYAAGTGGEATLKTAINLQEATLTIDPLMWAKPAGAPGEARLTLGFAGNRPVDLPSLFVEAGTLAVRGRGIFDSDGRELKALELEQAEFDGTRLSDVSLKPVLEGFDVRIGGGVFDTEPFLARDEIAGEGAASGDGGPEPPTVFTPFRLVAPRLSAVYFAPDRFLEEVALDVSRTRRGWERIAVSGEAPESLWSRAPKSAVDSPERAANGLHPEALEQEVAADEEAEKPTTPPPPPDRTLRLRFRPKSDGGQSLLVQTGDMGAALRALDILDTVHGGNLEIVGSSAGPVPVHPIHARMLAKDYIVVNAPGLARLLTVASLSGINDLLRGEGIRFTRLVGDIKLYEGKVETDLLRAYGPALGLTAKGVFDLEGAQSNVAGTLVPAYSVNRVLGKIPLLGRILTGGEGEGVFAVTYRVTGRLDDPEVSVNALSALAPGFLRGLFGIFDAEGGSDEDRPRALPERQEP